MAGLTGIRDLMKICKLLVYFYCQHVKMTMQLCDSTYLKADLCFKWSFEWYLLNLVSHRTPKQRMCISPLILGDNTVHTTWVSQVVKANP